MHRPDSTCCESRCEESATTAVDNTLNTLPIRRENLGIKPQKICSYQNCPAPLQTKKWRKVTPDTTAGGRNWALLVSQTLCDSCYSTYRKHGTFARSQRCANGGGWSRVPVEVDGSSAKPDCVALPLSEWIEAPQTTKRSSMENSCPGSASKRQCVLLRVGFGDVKDLQVEDGFGGTPRVSRSRIRKPSEKMKDAIQLHPTSVRITRLDTLDVNDGIPEMFDMAPIGHKDVGDEESMLEPTISSSDLDFCSSEMGLFCNLLGLEDEFLRISSSSDDDLIDACLD